MLFRRATALVLISGVFLGTLVFSLRRLEIQCIDGIYCREVTLPKEGLNAYKHADSARVDEETPAPVPVKTSNPALSNISAALERSGSPNSTPESECAQFPNTS